MSELDLQHRINNIQTAINLLTTTIGNPDVALEMRERAEARRYQLVQEQHALQRLASVAGQHHA